MRISDWSSDVCASDLERLALAGWWATVEPLLRPLEQAVAERRVTLPALVEVLIAAGATLCGDALWAGPVGRAASELLVRLGQHGDALGEVEPAALPALLVHMLEDRKSTR